MGSHSCRAGQCGMQFNSTQRRQQHEEMLHKAMFPDAVDRIVHKLATTSGTDAEKSVFQFADGTSCSYKTLYDMDKDSESYQWVRQIFTRYITDWLDNNPQHTLDDFFRIVKFSIR